MLSQPSLRNSSPQNPELQPKASPRGSAEGPELATPAPVGTNRAFPSQFCISASGCSLLSLHKHRRARSGGHVGGLRRLPGSWQAQTSTSTSKQLSVIRAGLRKSEGLTQRRSREGAGFAPALSEHLRVTHSHPHRSLRVTLSPMTPGGGGAWTSGRGAVPPKISGLRPGFLQGEGWWSPAPCPWVQLFTNALLASGTRGAGAADPTMCSQVQRTPLHHPERPQPRPPFCPCSFQVCFFLKKETVEGKKGRKLGTEEGRARFPSDREGGACHGLQVAKLPSRRASLPGGGRPAGRGALESECPGCGCNAALHGCRPRCPLRHPQVSARLGAAGGRGQHSHQPGGRAVPGNSEEVSRAPGAPATCCSLAPSPHSSRSPSLASTVPPPACHKALPRGPPEPPPGWHSPCSRACGRRLAPHSRLVLPSLLSSTAGWAVPGCRRLCWCRGPGAPSWGSSWRGSRNS